MNERHSVNYPCRSCVYFSACGDNMRDVPCAGRMTKSERKAAERSEAEKKRGNRK